MWEQMGCLLKQIISLCEALLNEAKKKEQFLLENRFGECADIFRTEEILSSELTVLQGKQSELLQSYCSDMNFPCNVTLIELIQMDSPVEKENILDLVQVFHRLSILLKQYTKKNQVLMERAKRFIDFNVNVLTQAVANDIYAPQGKEGAVLQKKKMFDQSV